MDFAGGVLMHQRISMPVGRCEASEATPGTQEFGVLRRADPDEVVETAPVLTPSVLTRGLNGMQRY
jgi:hypothetical protein